MLNMLNYDIKMYNKDGREGPTVRGVTFAQMLALTQTLKHYNIKHSVFKYEIVNTNHFTTIKYSEVI